MVRGKARVVAKEGTRTIGLVEARCHRRFSSRRRVSLRALVWIKVTGHLPTSILSLAPVLSRFPMDMDSKVLTHHGLSQGSFSHLMPPNQWHNSATWGEGDTSLGLKLLVLQNRGFKLGDLSNSSCSNLSICNRCNRLLSNRTTLQDRISSKSLRVLVDGETIAEPISEERQKLWKG